MRLPSRPLVQQYLTTEQALLAAQAGNSSSIWLIKQHLAGWLIKQYLSSWLIKQYLISG
jgi:hypothetical protein